MKLTELPRRTAATVVRVEAQSADDPIARRLGELGFVDGEHVEVLASGPFGAEPLLVQVGFTRFALRRAEAVRVCVRSGAQTDDEADTRRDSDVALGARSQPRQDKAPAEAEA